MKPTYSLTHIYFIKLPQIGCENDPCYPGVSCRDSDDGPICGPCPPGYQGDGTRNGCRRVTRGCNTDPCFRGVPCRDTESGFECGECPVGFEGDGISCIDINEVGIFNIIENDGLVSRMF